MELKTDNLVFAERTKRIFHLLERGRKQGSDLVLLPLFTNIQELDDLIRDKKDFLRGTNDYPDVFLLLSATEENKQVYLLISEGKVYNRLLIDQNSDIVLTMDLKNRNLSLNLAAPKENAKQSLVIHCNSSKTTPVSLKSPNTAHLFLTSSIQESPFLYYRQKKTDFPESQQKAQSVCLK